MVASSKMAAHQRWLAVVVDGHNKASGLDLLFPQGALAVGLVRPGGKDAQWSGSRRGPLTSGGIPLPPPRGPGGRCIIHKKCTHVSQHTYTLNLKNLIL